MHLSKPSDGVFRLIENRALSHKVRLLRFEGDSSAISSPGQFVSVALPGKFLRRPFSVCDWDEGWFSILVERVGEGTELLHSAGEGTEFQVLTGLGNGFDLSPCVHDPLLIGGGSGLSPLVGLARRLRMLGRKPQVLLGFREEQDRFGAELFGKLQPVYTDDVFPLLTRTPHEFFYACGSEAMMREVCRREDVEGQVAFDVRMGCGFGVCMGCSLKTSRGMKRVCKDGPVFWKQELNYDE